MSLLMNLMKLTTFLYSFLLFSLFYSVCLSTVFLASNNVWVYMRACFFTDRERIIVLTTYNT
jgi:hypothetical protein